MKRILEILRELQFLNCEVYAVGGCVRDVLIGNPINDIDVAVNTSPEAVMALAKTHGYTVIPTGIKHGTVTIMLGEEAVEVTTFRKDVINNGREAVVEFGATLKEDLARRDFTMNAMAIGVDAAIYDYFGGMRDIADGVIRTVGKPMMRFSEDYLRIIRLFRFAARFGFEIEEDTKDAAYELTEYISSYVSVERIVSEMTKAFQYPHADVFLEYMYDSYALDEFIDCFRGTDTLSQHPLYHPEGEVWEHTKQVVENAPPAYRWHALLHDCGKRATAVWDERGWYSFHGHEDVGANMIPEIAKYLRLPNNVAQEIEATTRYHMMPLHIWRNMGDSTRVEGNWKNQRAKRRLQAAVGPHLEAVKEVVKADRTGRLGPTDEFIEWLFEPLGEAIKPIVRGADLIAMGMKPGPKFGKILKYAFDYQIEGGATEHDKALLMLYAITKWLAEDLEE